MQHLYYNIVILKGMNVLFWFDSRMLFCPLTIQYGKIGDTKHRKNHGIDGWLDIGTKKRLFYQCIGAINRLIKRLGYFAKFVFTSAKFFWNNSTI